MAIDRNILNITQDIESYTNNTVYIDLFKNKIINIVKKSFFYNVFFEDDLPEHGWKIHISAIPRNAIKILQITSEYCIENKVDFKFLLDDVVLEKTLSKSWDRSSSGKFITIYPRNEEHFTDIIEDLHTLLWNQEGPYILSDKRYKDCKVLYYRYGRIHSKITKLIKGENENVLIGPNQEEYIDKPTPYFNLPDWIKDPFPQVNAEEYIGLKDGRFIIIEALHMSNSGGVYLAFDNHLNHEVILKEARPNVAVMGETTDSIKLRKVEERILIELEGEEGVPELYDTFYEWEHFFLVVEYIKGQDLIEFTLSPDNLEYKKRNSYKTFIKFITVFIDLLGKLDKIHKRKITIGDLTPYNIRVDNLNKVHFLDFELAVSDSVFNEAAYLLSTPGFRITKLKPSLENRFDIDKEAAGLVMLSFFCSTGSFFTLSSSSIHCFLNELEEDNFITLEFSNLIRDLIFTPNEIQLVDIVKRLKDIKKVDEAQFYNDTVSPLLQQDLYLVLEKSQYTIEQEIRSLNKVDLFKDSNGKYQNGLYEGVLGALLILKKLNSEFNSSPLLSEYIESNCFSVGNYGLLSGSVGIAYALEELGIVEIAKKTFGKALEQAETSNDYTLGSGKSGIGILALHLYKKYHNESNLEQALEIGKSIIDIFEKEGYGGFRDSDEILKWGYYEGLAGISYFLSKLYEETKDDTFLAFSIKIMTIVINSSLDIQGSFYLTPTEKKGDFSPYLNGASGAFLSLVSINASLDSREVSKVIERYYNTISYKYAKDPNYQNGLSGIGQVLLEAYQITSDKKYLISAENIVRSILIFQYEDNNMLYFPNNSLLSHSLEYSNGMSGIIDFLLNFYNTKYVKTPYKRECENAENKIGIKTLVN